MSSNSLLTNPESIRSNLNGQITKEQYSSLRSKLSDLPGGFTLAVMAALFVLALILGGKTLTHSTPLAIIALVAVILGTFAITSFLGNILAGLRMTHLSVEQVHGQVTWKNNRYSAISNWRTLEPVNNSLNLLPGDYTFSLLRGSKYILSAQTASTGGSVTAAVPTDIQALKALLDEPLDFDPAHEPERAAQHLEKLEQAVQGLQASAPANIDQQDLLDIKNRLIEQAKQLMHGQSLRNLAQVVEQVHMDSQPKLNSQGAKRLNSALEQVGIRHANTLEANQAGKQSADQRRGLVKEVSSNLFWAVIFGVGWVWISFYLITHGKWSGLLAVSILLLIILVATLSSARHVISDLVGGSVEVEEGWVSKYTHNTNTRNSRTVHYYKLNGNSFAVSQRAYDALLEGNYRVYLLPNTRAIVNLDLVISE